MHTSNRAAKLTLLNWTLHGAGALVMLSGLAAVHSTVFTSLDQQTAACATRTDHLKRLLQNAGRIRSEHHRLTNLKSEADARGQAILQRIPDEAQEAEFLSQLSELAQRANLNILDYRPGTPVEGENYWEMEVQLACRASYASLCAFLDGLHQLPRFTNLSRLDVVSDQESSYAVTMSVMLYFGLKKPRVRGEAVAHG
jgi:Tfp pilus assembly protein PilO